MRRSGIILLLALSACASPGDETRRDNLLIFNQTIAACEADESVDVAVCMKGSGYLRVFSRACPFEASNSQLLNWRCWGKPVTELTGAHRNSN